MKGRTNISGGQLTLNATTEEFQVADGQSITAGNFVQYEMKENMEKYDENSSYHNYFYSSDDVGKVVFCGNDRYILRYANKNERYNFIFNLIDVRDGFHVLSVFSIKSSYGITPAFCLLNDGNIAIAYGNKDIVVEIYRIESEFELIRNYEISTSGSDGSVRDIVQLGNSKIIISMYKDIVICDYENGTIENNREILNILGDISSLSVSNVRSGNLFPDGENRFFLYGVNGNNGVYSDTLFLFEENSNEVKKIDEIRMSGSGRPNSALWGNISSVNGKVLYSLGDSSNETSLAKDYYLTKIYYSNAEKISVTAGIDLLQNVRSSFSDLENYESLFTKTDKRYSSGTAQYVKENVFYAAVLPLYSGINKYSRTAIFRVEYDEKLKRFRTSNVVTFETGQAGYYGYRSGYGFFFESSSGDAYYLYETASSEPYDYDKTGRYLLKMTYKSGVLEIGENTGYIENYTGKTAIGVAKQSGTAGQRIEVYIPKEE